jgi:Flp pilus assembly protein TadG
MRLKGSALKEQNGAAAVEFAIVASIFFMLVFGIIDFGFGFHTWNGSAHAAREGARVASTNSTVADITGRVYDAANFLDASRMTVEVTCSRGGSGFSSCPSGSDWLEGDLVRVTVDYDYDFITPLPGFAGMGSDMTLHSQSETRFEGL